MQLTGILFVIASAIAFSTSDNSEDAAHAELVKLVYFIPIVRNNYTTDQKNGEIVSNEIDGQIAPPRTSLLLKFLTEKHVSTQITTL